VDAFEPIELANIRLDIKDRGFIEKIQVQDRQIVAFNTFQTNDRKADWIGAPWRARGEQASEMSIAGRGDVKSIPFHQVKMTQQDNVGEACWQPLTNSTRS
jgi:hypothetical protein